MSYQCTTFSMRSVIRSARHLSHRHVQSSIAPVVQAIFGSRDVRRSNADWRTDRCWDGRSGLDKCVRSKEAVPSVIKLGQFTQAEEPHPEMVFGEMVDSTILCILVLVSNRN